ncbi:MAG: hypothetical protein U9O98_00835 [Asgard group archaeon]|nr:hypothetical protein [Asgard group archaeon]
MSFDIERSHVIFKHLIHVGPDIDADAVVELATKRDYAKSTRQLKTPRGPLKEYLLRPKTDPQSLLVFSRKGFVIDTKQSKKVLTLFRDAYDFYEKVIGDKALNATVVMDVNGKFELYSPLPPMELVSNVTVLEPDTLTFSNHSVHTHGIVLASGSGKFPEEFIKLSIEPLGKDPDRRILASVVYRSTELDEALKFIENIDNSLLETLSKMKKFAKK